jgi:hypothetical protein
MFGVGVGVRVGGFTASSGGGFDPDAQAFFDRVTTAGGTLSETEKNATNQLVLDMKDAGIWSSMKAVYPMVGASAAACAQNLKSSSFTGTFTSGWTFASTGVTGNGTSSYFDTSLNVLSNLSQNNTHLSFYSRTDNDQAGVDIGTENTTIQYYAGTLYYRINTTTYAAAGAQPSDGFTLSSRITTTQQKVYKNGSILNTDNQGTNAQDNRNIYLGAWNELIKFPTDREYAFCSIGDGLSDAQVSNFNTAVQAFQTTLSRQV